MAASKATAEVSYPAERRRSKQRPLELAGDLRRRRPAKKQRRKRKTASRQTGLDVCVFAFLGDAGRMAASKATADVSYPADRLRSKHRPLELGVDLRRRRTA